MKRLFLIMACLPNFAFSQSGLGNGCAEIGFRVYIDNQSDYLELNEQPFNSMIESRLRAARVYDNSDRDFRLADVTFELSVADVFDSPDSGTRYRFDLNFRKNLLTDSWENVDAGITWNIKGFGQTTPEGGREVIISSVSEVLDLFVLEYLQANEEYCSG